MRVVRANGNLTAYQSADGATWQQMGNTVSVGLSGTVYAGLAVSSQDNTKLNTAVFDHVSITGPDTTSGAADFLVAASPSAQTIATGSSGAWTALTHQTYGAWAKAINVAAGTKVLFRATRSDSAKAYSSVYNWLQ